MDRKLIIGLALRSLLLVGCLNKSGQLKGLTQPKWDEETETWVEYATETTQV